MDTPLIVGVIGAGTASRELCDRAEALGAAIARHGWWVCCGGLGGVMEAVCRGAVEAGGHTLGILPGLDRDAANGWVEIPIVSGIADARNTIIARTAHCCVAVGGSYGTLTEMAFCMKFGTPVAILSLPEVASPLLEGVLVIDSVEEVCRWIERSELPK